MHKINRRVIEQYNGFTFFVSVKMILFIILFNAVPTFGQMLDNSRGNAFTAQPFFNAEFIQNNKIKRAKGSFMIRKPGKSFKNTEYYQVFEFSKAGELTLQSETYPDDGTGDTSLTGYEYDDKNELISIRKKTRDGFVAIDYERDSLGRVVRETVSKEFYDTSSMKLLHTEINEESYTYSGYDNQLKKVSYNGYGLPYLEEIFYYDDEGYLLKKTERIRMTSTLYTYSYEYNDRGLLSAIRKSANDSKNYLEELLFNYDEFGNLTEKHIYRNGAYTTEIQIIFNNKTGLLSSVVTRTIATGVLTILQFKDYQYYD